MLLILLSISSYTFAQQNIREVLKQKSSLEKPFELRDPFKRPDISAIKREVREKMTPKGVKLYTNLPTLGSVGLDDIEIIGVLIGKERRASVRKRGSKDVFTIKEGQILGENKAEVKAIMAGGLVLVEKLSNIYGEIEYLETVIPISK